MWPVTTRAEAEDAWAAIRKREHTATHHCAAYRLGVDGHAFRYSDDGEPKGTAGLPILRQIDALNLTQVLVVVTRYYGGTKLGRGGLVRAYSLAAEEALRASAIVENIIRVNVSVQFAYPDTSAAMHVLSQFDAPIVQTQYTEQTELLVAVRRSQVTALCTAFTEALHGRGQTHVKPSR